MNELARLTYKRIRRFTVLIIGSTVVLVGVALLLLPGPGMLIIFLGIALLATEFVWARILLKRAREGTSMMFRKFGKKASGDNRSSRGQISMNRRENQKTPDVPESPGHRDDD